MQITALKLQTDRLAAQRAFYTETLGWPLVSAAGNEFTVAVGPHRLTFVQGMAGRYHFAFDVPEDNIETAADWIAARTPLLPDPESGARVVDHAGWNAHAVYFNDPAGNVVEAIARHDRPNASGRPFTPADVIGLSEIGLGVADVQATARQICDRFGLGYYSKGGDTFSAVGDVAGLLILVQQGREWFPASGVDAEAIPTRVTLDVPGKTLALPPYVLHGPSSGESSGV
jgi:catechol-2,3-dioxygenase